MAELQRAVLFTSMACAAIAMAQNPTKKPPPPVEIGKTSDDPVRVQSTLVNDTGQIAHDLHITGSTKDTSIVGAGATLTPNPFSGKALGYDLDNNNNQNPRSITWNYFGGSVAKNGKIDLDLIAYLDRENNLYVSAHWTKKDGTSIGSALDMGFNVKGPISSSGGGDPLRQGGGVVPETSTIRSHLRTPATSRWISWACPTLPRWTTTGTCPRCLGPPSLRSLLAR